MAMHYEPGEYVFRVTKQGWKETTKEPKRPMLVFTGDPVQKVVRHSDGEESFGEVYQDPQYDRSINVLIDANDTQSLDYAMLKLRHAGFDGDSFAELNFVGKEIRAFCKQGEYKGQPSENWELALPPKEKDSRQLDSSMARQLDAVFGSRLKSGRKEIVPSKPAHEAAYEAQKPLNAHRSTSTSTDEVPF